MTKIEEAIKAINDHIKNFQEDMIDNLKQGVFHDKELEEIREKHKEHHIKIETLKKQK